MYLTGVLTHAESKNGYTDRKADYSRFYKASYVGRYDVGL